MSASLLAIENLSVALPKGGDRGFAVENVSISVGSNEIVCLVGESGSGKSITAHAVLGLLPPNVNIVSGAIRYGATDIASADEAAMRQLRGGAISMIFQEPLSALNPLARVGDQIAEMIVTHAKPARPARRSRPVCWSSSQPSGCTIPPHSRAAIRSSYPAGSVSVS